jgi:Ulp1 family protease
MECLKKRVEAIVIPILYNERHWLLVKMDFESKKFRFYDSLERVASDCGRKKIADVSTMLFFHIH